MVIVAWILLNRRLKFEISRTTPGVRITTTYLLILVDFILFVMQGVESITDKHGRITCRSLTCELWCQLTCQSMNIQEFYLSEYKQPRPYNTHCVAIKLWLGSWHVACSVGFYSIFSSLECFTQDCLLSVAFCCGWNQEFWLKKVSFCKHFFCVLLSYRR